MTRYHITPDNRRLRCRVTTGKCGYGTAKHFPSAAAADDYLKLQADIMGAQKPATPKPYIQNAINRPLGYQGEKPAWWQGYEQELAANPYGFDMQPEILDVIDSPDGKLAVVWQQDTLDKLDFYVDHGLITQNIYLKDFETGKNYGYIRYEYQTDASIARSFGQDEFTPFRMQAVWGDNGYNYDERLTAHAEPIPTAQLHELRQHTWLAAQQDLNTRVTLPSGEEISTRNLTAAHIPTDESVLRADLQKLAQQATNAQKNSRGRLKIPFVSYAHLNQPMMGKGYGTMLYVYAARRLAQDNLTFRSSDTQSGYGQAMWVGLRKNFPDRVKKYRYRWYNQQKTADTFDFRAA